MYVPEASKLPIGIGFLLTGALFVYFAEQRSLHAEPASRYAPRCEARYGCPANDGEVVLYVLGAVLVIAGIVILVSFIRARR